MHRSAVTLTTLLVVCAALISPERGISAADQSTRGTLPAAAAAESSAFQAPAWTYPGDPPATEPAELNSARLHHVPNSGAAFTDEQLHDMFGVPDWHPDDHPLMPEIVAHGRPPAVFACGYCHLPDGRGRPENAALAGLPAGYIVDQMAAFRSGARRSAWHGPSVPTDLMRSVALAATAAEIAAAAEYFARIPMTKRVQVVESRRVPLTHAAGWLYVVNSGDRTELLGERVVEVALDPARHELRDAAAGFRAYVPPGSVARGAELALGGAGGGAAACAACHGGGLRGGGAGPPIAGRSPTYIVRQLLAFKAGSRATAASEQMRPVVAPFAVPDMIALAAFVAAQAP